MMDSQALLRTRLYNQLLHHTTFKEPQEIVSYMGAMQAQNYDMAKWGIGVRLPGSTDKSIEKAINEGKIIRTHILRPTWHFITAEDYPWMFRLSIPRVKPIYTGYCKMSGVDGAFVTKALTIAEKVLEGGNHLTRQEMAEVLVKNGIQADASLTNMVMCHGEMEGIVCNGRIKNKKQTYALVKEWIPEGSASWTKEESLKRLAERFFTSHGPATLEDFVWWSGLLISEGRQAIDLIGKDFVSENSNGRTFWMKPDTRIAAEEKDHFVLLPPFDEFVVSYKNRSELIKDLHYGKVMTKNGLFSPTVMWNGEIIGSWKKVKKKGAPETEFSFFEKKHGNKQKRFHEAAERVKKFYTECLHN